MTTLALLKEDPGNQQENDTNINKEELVDGLIEEFKKYTDENLDEIETEEPPDLSDFADLFT